MLLDEVTIASLPLEALYKRIDQHQTASKSSFDMRLSQAIKKSQGELRNSKVDESKLPPALSFEQIRARLLGRRGPKSAQRSQSSGTSLVKKISKDFEAHTRMK